MEPTSGIVTKLFDDYERGIGTPDPELSSDIYENSFVFAVPHGVQVIRKEDLLRALPRRQAYFQSVSLVTTKVRSLEEARLDDHYLMVKAHWNLQFEKGPGAISRRRDLRDLDPQSSGRPAGDRVPTRPPRLDGESPRIGYSTLT